MHLSGFVGLSLQTVGRIARISICRNQGHAVIESDSIAIVASVRSMPIPGRRRHWQERRLIWFDHFRLTLCTEARAHSSLEHLAVGDLRISLLDPSGAKLCVPPTLIAQAKATGIFGFDDIIGGGLPHACTMLLMGGQGSGKTLFSLQFLAQGAQAFRELGIFVGLEESAERIIAIADSFGWLFSKAVRADDFAARFLNANANANANAKDGR